MRPIKIAGAHRKHLLRILVNIAETHLKDENCILPLPLEGPIAHFKPTATAKVHHLLAEMRRQSDLVGQQEIQQHFDAHTRAGENRPPSEASVSFAQGKRLQTGG